MSMRDYITAILNETQRGFAAVKPPAAGH